MPEYIWIFNNRQGSEYVLNNTYHSKLMSTYWEIAYSEPGQRSNK